MVSAMVERLGQTTPVQEGRRLIPYGAENFFPYAWWMSWLTHPWHVWPWIDCQSLMVRRKTSVEAKNVKTIPVNSKYGVKILDVHENIFFVKNSTFNTVVSNIAHYLKALAMKEKPDHNNFSICMS